MTQFLHLADVHLGHRQYNHIEREDDMYRTFRTTVGAGVDESVDFVIHAGDLFHNKDVDARVLSDAEEGLGILAEEGVPFVTIQGNHDANLYAQELTWLEYLHLRGRLLLLEAELSGDDQAYFKKHEFDDPGTSSGYVDLDGVRIFGLQYRGQHISTDIPKVAEGIQHVNEREGTPDATVLIAHFGIEGHVPGLGANVSYNDLSPLEDVVDYLAIGHIHKAYEHENWVFNPGSPEVHSVREEEWDHGYYLADVSPNNIDVTPHPTKRRPFYRFTFNVDEYGSPSELEEGFEREIRTALPEIETKQDQEQFKAQGDRRNPVLDLRLDGLLQFDRANLDTDALCEIAADITGALTVQPSTSVRSVGVQELLAGLEDEDDVWEGDRLNKERLEGLVFQRIAENSQYDEKAQEVAGLLASVKESSQTDEGPEGIADVIQSRRRELFAPAAPRGDDE